MGTVLRDKVRGSGSFHGFFYGSVILRGDSNDVYVWKKTFDPPSGLDSTDPGHFHIHNNDLRKELKGHLNSCLSVHGRTDNGQAFVILKETTEGLPKGRKVIDHENAKQSCWA